MVIIFAALLAFGIFVLQRNIYSRLWKKGVTVELNFEKNMVRAGEEVKLMEVVENRKWRPLSSLKVKFQCSKYLIFPEGTNSSVTDRYYRNDLFSVMPYQRITRTHRIVCPKRGYYGIYGIDLVGADLFFSEEMVASLNSETVLYVLPRVLHYEQIEQAFRRISGEIVARRYEIEDPFTYKGIREYQPFDEPKAINWKATARTDELKVNVRENTSVNGVRIFMNLEDNAVLRREELLEESISLCSGIAERLLGQGVRLSVFSNARDCVSGQMLCMENLVHMVSMDDLSKGLARLDLGSDMEKFGEVFHEKLFEDRDLVYTIFISPDIHEDYQQVLVEYHSSIRADFVWVCPVKKEGEQDILEELKQKVIFIKEQE